jgi:hypothetical protein
MNDNAPSKLGKASENILIGAVADRRTITGGRGGYNTAVLEKLAARGLIVFVSKFTHNSNWALTELGRQVACAVAFHRGFTTGNWF